ncbi:MAG TPA: peptidyl-prolyl cis-trans isomerase [Terracidiphilus sp.]|jgi:peptidyl-prolyl cis-trans isomerase D
MIRFLQSKDNRVVKALFVVIIAAASISMVVYLIPGLTAGGGISASTYAVVYPHWYSRFFASGEEIPQEKVSQQARQQLQQRGPQYASNPMIVNMFEQQVGQQLVQQQILLAEAERLGISASSDDVISFLHQGQAGQVLFPNGKFIGQDQYASLIATRFDMSVPDFEESVKRDITIQRLRSYVTAGVTVGAKEARDQYTKENTKIKFDYAVISSDDIRKSINPSDADLEAFFKKNAVRYANAVPEERTIQYFAFTPNDVPGGVQQPTQQEIAAYYNAHKSEYSVPEQAKSRHILVQVAANSDAKVDAAAKAKAEDVLKQLQNGGNWTELAKKNSDDPGSKDNGGELGFAKHGMMVGPFDTAIFTQKIGDIKMIKTQYGYHIVQVEERTPAHTQDLSEVLPTIQATLIRQKTQGSEDAYAHALTSEAIKNGLDKTAAAHHLQVVTTPPVNAQGVIPTLPDGSQLIAHAFEAKASDPPQSAATGEGYAIFQVKSVIPSHAPTFADWKSHVEDDYKNDRVPALLTQKTAELAAKAKAENDLAKAAKEVGASFKTSDLVDLRGQVPDFGAVGQVAPQLFDMMPGSISGPINAGRTGVVVKLDDKQQPTDADIAKSLDQTKDQMLEQKRQEAFEVFASTIINEYKKSNRVRLNAKASQSPLSGE